MKKIMLVAVSILMVFVLTAYELPPELPSSFWGEVSGGRAGQQVTTNMSGSTETFIYNGKVVYAINVTHGTEGQTVVFYVNGIRTGSGIYHVGTNQNLNLQLRIWRPISPKYPVLPGGVYR
jgi:hypothetical protein